VQETLSGRVGAPGVAVGTVLRWPRPAAAAGPRRAGTPEQERDALRAALRAVAERLDTAAAAAPGATAREVLLAQAAMVRDPALLERAEAVVAGGGDAATAVEKAAAGLAAGLAASGSQRIGDRAADVAEVGDLVAAALRQVAATGDRGGAEPAAALGGASLAGAELPSDAVVVAAELGPAATVELVRAGVLAFVLEASSPTAHTAILARTHGLPTVVQVGAAAALRDGLRVAVDGDAGAVHLDPDDALVTRLEERAAAVARRRAGRDLGTVELADGRSVALAANVGSAEQATTAASAGARRVGLLRTEFLFLERADLPDEDEQTSEYRTAVAALGGGRVVLRTLDVGGDKPLPALEQPPEPNPMLGRRGIRLSLHHPDLLDQQLRAMLRASDAGPVGIMFPMVATVEEVAAARAALERCRARLRTEGVPVGDDVTVGIMVETPAAVLTADALAEVVDFFSIGTNDLLQYTFAADRDNTDVSVLLDPLSPALLRAVRMVVDAAAARDVPVAVCGEAAADPHAQLLLVGLGVAELSMAAPALAATAENLERRSAVELTRLAERALALRTADEVRALLDELTMATGPAADTTVGTSTETTVEATTEPAEHAERTITIGRPDGLHARPASELCALVQQHASTVTVRHGGREADASSVLSLLTLAVDTGETITVTADGPDAGEVVAAITHLLARDAG
jgi:phosphoenolpyruvate-protein phosphotransferase